MDLSHLNNDTMANILKNYSFYPEISKQYYNPYLFYEQYCHLEPSINEFIKFITQVQPDQFGYMGLEKAIEDSDDEDAGEYQGLIYKIKIFSRLRNPLIYSVLEFSLYDRHLWIDSMNIYENQMIEYIQEDLDDMDNIKYDLNTIDDLFYLRKGCQSFNKNYNRQAKEQYIENMVKNIPVKINNLLDAHDYVLYYLYFNIQNIKDNYDIDAFEIDTNHFLKNVNHSYLETYKL